MSNRARLWSWICMAFAVLALVNSESASADIFVAAAFVIRGLSKEVV